MSDQGQRTALSSTASLAPDLVDRVAREAAAQVCDHIEQMYPDAARAVAWKSARRSIQGVIRNLMAEAARAAEAGDPLGGTAAMRARRRRLHRTLRR